MATETALICLDTSIVAGTKADQAVWILQQGTAQRDDILNRFSLLEVVDDATKVEAEKAQMFIRGIRNAQDEQRKEWGRPFDLAKKAMDTAMRDHIVTPESSIYDELGRKVASYVAAVEEAERKRKAEAQRIIDEANAKLEAERQAAEDKARAEAEANKVEYVPPPAVGIPEIVMKDEPPRVIARAEGMKYRRWWKYEVVDLALVPDAYTKRVINEDAVETAIKAATTKKGEAPSECSASIPGIRIYSEDRPA
jgi:regulator of protease activity HflC (stomatin/prohibitin superfamily)